MRLLSADTIDDLHDAEDRIGQLTSALGRLIAAYEVAAWLSPDVIATVKALATSTYCRPSCGADGPRAACEADDDCGCPCHASEDT